jgi:hypothetical protein
VSEVRCCANALLCCVVPTLCLRCTVTVHWTLVVASDSCFFPSPSLLRLLLFLCPVCSIPGRKCKKSSPMALWALYCVDGDVSGSRASEQPSYTAWLGLHSSPSSRVSPLSLFSEKGLSTPACLAVWPSVCLPAWPGPGPGPGPVLCHSAHGQSVKEGERYYYFTMPA